MFRRLVLSTAASAVSVAALAGLAVSNTSYAQGGPQPSAARGNSTAGPVPRHDLSGTWMPADGTGVGIQANGVQAMPNDGKPEHALPYTPYGLEVYESHKALEGLDAVLPAAFWISSSR